MSTPEEREALRDQLRRQSPDPFAELLIDALQQKPLPEDWRKLAASAPDKYTKAVKQISGIIGYDQNIVVQHTHRHLLEAMSDSELIAFIREQRKALPLPLRVIEATAIEVKGGPAAHGPHEADLRDAGIVLKEDD